MLDYLPIPFRMSQYGADILADQISVKLIVFAHIPTVIVTLAFAIFLYKKTKQLSALYLLLLSCSFAAWAYFDLLAWSTDSHGIIFAWSVLDMFNITFTFLAYWFLYTFIKGTDVPLWQKVASVAFLIPTLVYTLLSKNMDTFFAPTQYALEDANIPIYVMTVNILFLVIIALFTFFEYLKAQDIIARKKILFGGLGTVAFLSVFTLSFMITNTLLYFEIGDPIYVYNATTYSLLGMPALVGVLGYLIAKYQAFDIKLLKTVGLIIILQLLLFITIFI